MAGASMDGRFMLIAEYTRANVLIGVLFKKRQSFIKME
jgi:hypothetical protein